MRNYVMYKYQTITPRVWQCHSGSVDLHDTVISSPDIWMFDVGKLPGN